MNWTELSPLQKSEQAVQMTEVKGYSYSQAAQALGTTRTAVAGAIDRARMRAGNPPRPPRPPRTTPENRKPSKAGTTAKLRGSTAIAQEKARRARALAQAKAHAPADEQEESVSRRLLASEIWQPLPGSTPVGLMERTGCTWAVGENPTLFCNEPGVDDRFHWCPTHYALGNRPIVDGAKKRVAPKPKTLKGLTS